MKCLSGTVRIRCVGIQPQILLGSYRPAGAYGELSRLKGFKGTLVKAVSNKERRCER